MQGQAQAIEYGQMIDVNGVNVTFLPAGHVLGMRRSCSNIGGRRVIISGDYKRRRDPTCEAFTPRPCDLFISEATFGLPVFHHPPDHEEIAKILEALELEKSRCVCLALCASANASA